MTVDDLVVLAEKLRIYDPPSTSKEAEVRMMEFVRSIERAERDACRHICARYGGRDAFEISMLIRERENLT